MAAPPDNPYRPPESRSGGVAGRGRIWRVLALSLPLYLLSIAIGIAVLAIPMRLLLELPSDPAIGIVAVFIVAWLLLAYVGDRYARRCWKMARRLSR